MTTTSRDKNLKILVILVVLLFIVALVWKNINNNSNAEKVIVKNYSGIVKKTPDVERKKYNFDVSSNKYDKKQEYDGKGEKRMGWAYKYTNKKQILQGIEKFEKSGDVEAVAELKGLLKQLEEIEK